jgi:hypothetical protein
LVWALTCPDAAGADAGAGADVVSVSGSLSAESLEAVESVCVAAVSVGAEALGASAVESDVDELVEDAVPSSASAVP